MRICSILLLLAGAAAAGEPARRVSTMVRADLASGRLVRSVVITPKVIAPRLVPSRPVGADLKSGRADQLSPEANLDEIIEHTARKYDVDPLLVHSIIKVESNYNQYALSNRGAEGLMQLIPSTARRFGINNSFDAGKNIEGGVRYLKYLQGLYGNDLRRILAAYNAGEGAVTRYGGIPRFPETVSYVYMVGKRFGQLAQAQRARQSTQAAAKESSAAQGTAADAPRPVESFVDSEGRVHFRTR